MFPRLLMISSILAMMSSRGVALIHSIARATPAVNSRTVSGFLRMYDSLKKMLFEM